jgi:hypothetical protein
MLTRMRVSPLRGDVNYEVEGSIDEFVALDPSYFDKLTELAKKISTTLDKGEQRDDIKQISQDSAESKKVSKSKNNSSPPAIQVAEIEIPQEFIEGVKELDERTRFSIIWSFSNRPRMTIKEFLIACAKKGFALSSSWLPSEGGNFRGRLVNEDRMFHDVEKVGRELVWELTDVGRLKVMRELEKLKGTHA